MYGNKIVLQKERENIKMGRAMIYSFAEENSKRMPHKNTTMERKAREIMLVIPNM